MWRGTRGKAISVSFCQERLWGVLAGQASLRKAVFELDPKGLARFLQAGEGKKGQSRQEEQRGKEHGGRKAWGTSGDTKNTAPLSTRARRGQAQEMGLDHMAGPACIGPPVQLSSGAGTGGSWRDSKQANDSSGEDFSLISSQRGKLVVTDHSNISW